MICLFGKRNLSEIYKFEHRFSGRQYNVRTYMTGIKEKIFKQLLILLKTKSATTYFLFVDSCSDFRTGKTNEINGFRKPA